MCGVGMGVLTEQPLGEVHGQGSRGACGEG